MLQDVTRAAEPDDVKGAVVIGMMAVNSLRAFAFSARLDFNPSVASHDRDDGRSVFAPTKPFIRLQQPVTSSHVNPGFHFQFLMVFLSIPAVIRAVALSALIAAARNAKRLSSTVTALIGALDGATAWHQSKVATTLFHVWSGLPSPAVRTEVGADFWRLTIGVDSGAAFRRLLIGTNARLAPIMQSVEASS